MDPFELLKKDHEAVAELFKRIDSASGKAKLGVFKQIKSELDLHTHIEEAIFYPALEKANETRALTLEAYEEHKVVKDLLGELDAAKGVTDEWVAKLTVLKENVEHHVDEEENELFDKASDVLTGEEAESLGERMRAEKVARGGSAPAPSTTEEPGLLRKIANALGVGTSSQKASKAVSKKKPPKKPAKKSSTAPTKTRGSKTTKSSSASARKEGTPSRKSRAASVPKSRSASPRKRAGQKAAAGKRPGARKRTSAKKAGRSR